MTQLSNGWSVKYRQEKLNQLIRGWIAYFKLAKCKGKRKKLDRWLRRRIRMRTRFRELKRLGVERNQAFQWETVDKDIGGLQIHGSLIRR
ncbi:MAG TPA: hypothetical protein DCR02_03860 [Sphaerochaeta sp.]|nr:hypothetical protein [Sphaerochaeta sp.]